jgi:hypothetical protein
MSLLYTRSGKPHIFNDTITTAGRIHDLRGYSKWLRVTATTNPCLLYFSEEDFTSGTNFITVATATPFEAPLEINKIWIKGSGGDSDVALVASIRLN